ncbi:hypothetical protein C9421_30175, partial [Klebsiella pneumoniae]
PAAPAAAKENSALLAKVDANFKKVDSILSKYRNIDGAQKCRPAAPAAAKENSALLAKVDANFKKVDSILSKYR